MPFPSSGPAGSAAPCPGLSPARGPVGGRQEREGAWMSGAAGLWVSQRGPTPATGGKGLREPLGGVARAEPIAGVWSPRRLIFRLPAWLSRSILGFRGHCLLTSRAAPWPGDSLGTLGTVTPAGPGTRPNLPKPQLPLSEMDLVTGSQRVLGRVYGVKASAWLLDWYAESPVGARGCFVALM